MSRSFWVGPGEYLPSGPVLWCARRVFTDAGWSEVTGLEEADAVITFGSDCRRSAAWGGVFLVPPLTDAAVVEAMNDRTRPRLVVGVTESADWSPSAAARLHGAEVLQLPRVGPDFELAGDMPYTLSVLARLTDRLQSLVRRLEAGNDER